MTDYILFIDTETSGIPKNLRISEKKTENWPYVLQIGWVICKASGDEICKRNFYINPGEIEINPASFRIHQISIDFLKQNGQNREKVLQQLAIDLGTYHPMIVGHFLKFDQKMLNVEFFRSHLICDLTPLPSFCTMHFSKQLTKNAFDSHYMRLGELYNYLFHKKQAFPHNAYYDAIATKDCFFELCKQNKITDEVISEQQNYLNRKNKFQWWTLFFTSIAVIFFIIFVTGLIP